MAVYPRGDRNPLVVGCHSNPSPFGAVQRRKGKNTGLIDPGLPIKPATMRAFQGAHPSER
jgi:hypothetical protein